MRPIKLCFLAVPALLPMVATAPAQGRTQGSGTTPAAEAGQAPDGPAGRAGISAPPSIEETGGVQVIMPDQHEAIWNTDGLNPTPGSAESVRCPGGQVLTQAQGDVKNPDCR